MTDRLQTYFHQVQEKLKQRIEPYIERKRTLKNHHHNERQRLKQAHEERWQKESLQRSQRLPKGLKGIWFRMTGKYQNIRKQNDRETEMCRIRDRDEKHNLIDRQLKERQKIQKQISPILQEHQRQILELKQVIGRYMEMSGPSQKTLQEEFGQVQPERDIDQTPEM